MEQLHQQAQNNPQAALDQYSQIPTTGAVVLGQNVPNQVQPLPEQQIQQPQQPQQQTQQPQQQSGISTVEQFTQLVDTIDPQVLDQFFVSRYGINTNQFRDIVTQQTAQQYQQQSQQQQQQVQPNQQTQQVQANPFDQALSELQTTWGVDQNETMRRLQVISEEKSALLQQHPEYDTLDNVKLWWSEMQVRNARASQPDRNSSIIGSAVPQRPQYLFTESQIAAMSEPERRAKDAAITMAYAQNQVLLDM